VVTVIAAAGGHVHVWGLSSGAVLALDAAAVGVPMLGSPCKNRPWWSTPATGDRPPTCASGSPS
jgi:hypothetical protein